MPATAHLLLSQTHPDHDLRMLATSFFLGTSSDSGPKSAKFLTEVHFPNESLPDGYPDPKNAKRLPTLPEIGIPSQHPGMWPPPGGPEMAGSLEIPNMYPEYTIRGFAAHSSLIQVMSALNVLKEAAAQAVTIMKGNVAIRVRSEQAFLEATQMDPDPTTKLMLRQLQNQARRTSARSEKFIHSMAVAVKQAELAVQAMRGEMKAFLDLPQATLA